MKRLRWETFTSLTIGALSLFLNKIVAGYGYGGYDLGLLYGAQNIMLSGQDLSKIPFVLPLLFAWLIKISAEAFGNTFYAPFVASSLTYACILAGGNYLYIRARTRGIFFRPLSLLVFTLAITINLLNPGHLWHSDLTSWIALSILWCAYCIRGAWSIANRVLIGALAALVLLCKPNLAPLYYAGYSIFTIKSCFFEKYFSFIKAIIWILLPVVLSVGLALIFAHDLGINLSDYFFTLRSIAAERGSPLADPENYLKFIPSDFLNLGFLLIYGRNISFNNSINSHALLLFRLLWLIGFYLSCMILPLLAIRNIHRQHEHTQSKIPALILPRLSLLTLITGLLASIILALTVSFVYPFLQWWGLFNVATFLMTESYFMVFLLVFLLALFQKVSCKVSTDLSSKLQSSSPLAVLSMSFFFASYIGLGSNWDLKSSDLSVSLLSLYIFWDVTQFNNEKRTYKQGRKYFSTAIILAGLLSSISAITRLRMSLVGYPAGINNIECKLKASKFWGDSFLSSLPHCTLDNELRTIISDLKNMRKIRVFFGPRMETYYAAMSLNSPLDMPIWWHPGTSFPATDSDLYTNRFVSADYQVLVFVKDEFFRMPPAIIEYISSGAYVRLRCSKIDIFLDKQLVTSFKSTSVALGNCWIR